MARKGYDGATIADVAKAAGLSPGLVHYHFQSKQEILLAALDELGEQHLARLDAKLLEQGGDARAELTAFIDFHLGLGAHADPEALACWILLSGEALRAPEVQRPFARVLAELQGRLRAVIERGVASGVFGGVSPEAAASALVAAVQGYFVLAATARPLIPKGTAAAMTRRMAAGLLGSAP